MKHCAMKIAKGKREETQWDASPFSEQVPRSTSHESRHVLPDDLVIGWVCKCRETSFAKSHLCAHGCRRAI